MKQIFWIIAMIVFTMLNFSSLDAANQGVYPITPKTHDGKKWRIAYYQGGPYIDYQTILEAVIKGMMKLKWIEEAALPKIEDPANTRKLWTWMSKNLKSDTIELVADAYYDSEWEKDRREKTRIAAIRRFNENDIDLVFAFGTWAGQDLANNEHSTLVEVISASDPLGAHIVKSIKDSGFDQVHAKIEPTRYEIQVQLFHDIIGFERLGVVYENTPEGKTYAAIDKIESIAKERGFKIVRCFAQFTGVTAEEAENQVLNCHQKLAPQVDAFYLTVHRGVNLKVLPKLLAPLNKYRVPTFSQSGSIEVLHGALLSMAQAGYKYAGEFHATAIAKIFNGAKPRDLNQVFKSPPRIAINLAVAAKIEYRPPIAILGAADEIYQGILVKK